MKVMLSNSKTCDNEKLVVTMMASTFLMSQIFLFMSKIQNMSCHSAFSNMQGNKVDLIMVNLKKLSGRYKEIIIISMNLYQKGNQCTIDLKTKRYLL